MLRFSHSPRLRLLWCALCVVLLGVACDIGSGGGDQAAADSNRGRPRPRDAQDAVLEAFDDYQVVGGFSALHGSKGVDEFLLDLIRNPELPGTVDDIAFECGNALHQGVLDRYIAGEDVPLAEVRKVWRDGTQVECGFATFLEQMIPLVRRINQGLPDDDKLRVLACNPPVDWSRVDSVEDLEEDRAQHTATIMEQEVLSQGRQALMLFGINHMRHVEGTAVGIYEANGYDGLTYVIDDHQGFGNQDPALREDNDELESRMARWPRPSIVEIEGTFLEDLDTAYFNDVLPGEDQGTGNPGVDAYLYLGPRDSLLRSPRSAQAMTDEAYIAELRDRAARVGAGPDSPRHPDNIFRTEAEAGPFLFDPDRAPAGNGQGTVTEGGDGPPGDPPEGGSEGEGSVTAGVNGSGG